MTILPGLGRYTDQGATFDEARVFRYRLWRRWDATPSARIASWTMLNPSTADEFLLDPTLRAVERFSRREGCHGFTVTNLFPLRSTDPDAMVDHPGPWGPEQGAINLEHIRACVAAASLVVVAWGTHKMSFRGSSPVLTVLRAIAPVPVLCLGRTKNGSPMHPLYLKTTTPLVPFFADGGR